MKLFATIWTFFIMQTMTFAAGSLHKIPLQDIDGNQTSLGAYQGKTILLVNVASKCGYTPQYKGLESLYRKYKSQGLVVVAIPSNDFGAQEPGTPDEIKQFCSSTYDVTFPLMQKMKLKGDQQHPLYAALTGKDPAFPGEVKWNFGKFLIAPDGKLVARFDSKVAPDAPELVSAIEKHLPGK